MMNVAVLGCGYWGKNLVRTFHDLGALAAVHDPDPDVARYMAHEYGAPARSVEAILADPAVGAVAIAAPAWLHASLGLRALRAGKHVFVEKPIALSLDEAREMERAAREAGRVLMVGHLLQYHPVFVKLREMVAAGDLGQLRHVYSNRLNLGKIRREEDVLWSFAPHDLSMILALVGEEPERVYATGGAWLHKQLCDTATAHVSFASGVEAHVFVSWLHPFKEQKLVAVGERAMAVFDDGQPWERKLTIYPHRIDWQGGVPEPVKAEGQAVVVAQDEPLKCECRHFLEVAAAGGRALTDGAEGVRVLKLLHAAEASLKSGEVVGLGAEKAERFAGAFVHDSAIVDDGAEIGAGSKIWHFSHVLGRVKIGRNVSVGQNVMIGPDVSIGDNCKIQNNVSLYKGVMLEDGVFCGPSCVFTNVNNPRAEIERKNEFRTTLVKHGATIGANATIVCGTTLGEYSFVGAGAVVTKDVPAHALVVGNPARIVGWMSKAGHRLGSDFSCPETGTRYRLDEDALLLQEVA
ncbi:Gfo/Idh/MocA family oxidoreductase [Shinella zoogloeoides]|uniref:Oxidoreductase n=1 Tax=Shinella zoogloeoides TaxID=352475 RepID=A0A6N8TKC9_SHIZO|nr:Gfo/Idh/MocA family oxidoreductase [Shinella zoogloeoides]MXO02716.1 oxidoreductase [Shinella zoogloeoides]